MTFNPFGVRITAVISEPHGVAATAIIDCLPDGGTPEQALTLAGRLQAPREDFHGFKRRLPQRQRRDHDPRIIRADFDGEAHRPAQLQHRFVLTQNFAEDFAQALIAGVVNQAAQQQAA